MSTITPPPPASPPSSTPPPSPTVTVQLPPPEISNLSVGAKLDAVILGLNERGEVQLQTSLGKITVQSKFPFPDNGIVNLQLTSKGSLVKFLITAINGQPPASFSKVQVPLTILAGASLTGMGALGTGTQASAQTTAQAGSQAGGILAPPSLLNIGSGLTATLIRPGINITGTNITSITNIGTIGTASTATTSTPQALTAGQTATTPIGASSVNQATSTGHGNNINQAPSNLSGQQLMANQFSVKIVGLEPATGKAQNFQTSSNVMANFSAGKTIPGVVTGSTVSGQTLVSTSAGQIALSTQTPLPQGTQLSLLVTGQSNITAEQSSVRGALKEPSQLARLNFEHGGRWENLTEAFKAIEQINPAISQHLMNILVPRPDISLGPQLLFFLAALKGGDLKNWMGDSALRALGRSRPELLDRLKGDFEVMSKSADDTSPKDWRLITIPFFNNDALDRLRFYSQQQGENDENEDENKIGTRFIVDLNLSQMGRLQLDGRVNDHTKRFDLFIRTDNILPAKIQNGVRTIFLSANETIGTRGGLTFQAAPAMFFDPPLKQISEEHIGMNV